MPDQPPISSAQEALAQRLLQRESDERERLRKKYLEIIQRLWTEPDTCPVCGSNTWDIGDLTEMPLRVVAMDLGLQGKPVYVYVPVACLKCGYTRFFHSGILDARAETRVSEEPWRT